MEDLAVVWREEVCGEDDKGVCPHKDGVFNAPPLVIVEMVLLFFSKEPREGTGHIAQRIQVLYAHSNEVKCTCTHMHLHTYTLIHTHIHTHTLKADQCSHQQTAWG